MAPPHSCSTKKILGSTKSATSSNKIKKSTSTRKSASSSLPDILVAAIRTHALPIAVQGALEAYKTYNSNNELSQLIECSICRQPCHCPDPHSENCVEQAVKLVCGHIIGHECIARWIDDKGEEANCPLCRTSLTFSRCKHPIIPLLAFTPNAPEKLDPKEIPSNCFSCDRYLLAVAPMLYDDFAENWEIMRKAEEIVAKLCDRLEKDFTAPVTTFPQASIMLEMLNEIQSSARVYGKNQTRVESFLKEVIRCKERSPLRRPDPSTSKVDLWRLNPNTTGRWDTLSLIKLPSAQYPVARYVAPDLPFEASTESLDPDNNIDWNSELLKLDPSAKDSTPFKQVYMLYLVRVTEYLIHLVNQPTAGLGYDIVVYKNGRRALGEHSKYHTMARFHVTISQAQINETRRRYSSFDGMSDQEIRRWLLEKRDRLNIETLRRRYLMFDFKSDAEKRGIIRRERNREAAEELRRVRLEYQDHERVAEVIVGEHEYK